MHAESLKFNDILLYFKVITKLLERISACCFAYDAFDFDRSNVECGRTNGMLGFSSYVVFV